MSQKLSTLMFAIKATLVDENIDTKISHLYELYAAHQGYKTWASLRAASTEPSLPAGRDTVYQRAIALHFEQPALVADIVDQFLT